MKNKFKKLAFGAAATAALGMNAHAQSSVDALLSKLEQKGILTVEEAKALRDENQQDSAADFSKAMNAKLPMPDWVTSYRLSGDMRTRYEENNAENSEYFTRDRYRLRLRLGLTISMVNDFEVGFRLASGNPQTNPGGTLVGGQPITANQDLGWLLESRKFLWIDTAYAKWTPIHNDDWRLSVTLGKMDNPFLLSNMIWDYDVDPEGGAFQIAYHINSQHTLRGIGAFFVLDELNQATALIQNPNNDPYLYGGQFLLESKWTPKFETTVGIAAFNIVYANSLSAQVQPLYNSGNTRNVNGFLVYNYNPVIATASATYKLSSFPFYNGTFPFKVSGEYMDNPGAPANNVAYRVGATLGKAGTKGTWELNYRYQYLEADAWFDALVDDDNGAFYPVGSPQLNGTGKASGWFGGTNVKGHLIQATYSFTDFLNLGFTCYLNDLIIGKVAGQSSQAAHFMAEMMWKF